MRAYLLQITLVSMMVLMLTMPAVAQESADPYNCAAQGMRQIESGACAPLIGGVWPANGAVYTPEELWAINDWRHIYDRDAGAWYWQQYSTGYWYWG